MIQVLYAVNTQQPSGTQSSSIMGGPIIWPTVDAPWSAPGVFRNLVVEVSAAPGVGTSRTFALRKNASATALTVTISDTATTARLTGVDITVAAGDRLGLQHSASGAPAAAHARWSFEFEGTTANESGYSGYASTANGGTSPRYFAVFNPAGQLLTTAADVRNVVAAAGTLTRTDSVVSAAPAAGNGFTFYVNKNGTRQDGSGGTVNTACAHTTGAVQASGTYSLPLVAGDIVYLEAVVTGTFTTRGWAVSTAFTATTTGQAQLCGSGVGFASGSVEYAPAVAMAGSKNASETGFVTRAIPGVTTARLSGLQVLLASAPTAGKSRTIDLRVAAASPGVSATVSDSATTASDLTHTADIVDGSDRWNIRSTPAGNPATQTAYWSFIQGPAAAVVAAETVQPFVWMPV